jgi:hypothetical protein
MPAVLKTVMPSGIAGSNPAPSANQLKGGTMAKILRFPVQHACPTCQRPCGEDELSQCLRCGQKWCQFDTGECECDRFAREMAQRAQVWAEDERYKITGRPIEEPAEENVLALQFIHEQFGERGNDETVLLVSANER